LKKLQVNVMADEEKVMTDEAAPVKETAVKKAAVKKAATKKAEVKKAAVKKAAVKKASPKKAAAAKSDSAVKRVSVTLVRSKHHRLAAHKACVAGLGLRRMHQTVEVIDTPENRGMINKIHYMLKVEEA
jgi:large subunit ribosomal protein L30